MAIRVILYLVILDKYNSLPSFYVDICSNNDFQIDGIMVVILTTIGMVRCPIKSG